MQFKIKSILFLCFILLIGNITIAQVKVAMKQR